MLKSSKSKAINTEKILNIAAIVMKIVKLSKIKLKKYQIYQQSLCKQHKQGKYFEKLLNSRTSVVQAVKERHKILENY